MSTATEQQAAATASDDVSYSLLERLLLNYRLFRAAAQCHQTLRMLIFMAYVIICLLLPKSGTWLPGKDRADTFDSMRVHTGLEVLPFVYGSAMKPTLM